MNLVVDREGSCIGRGRSLAGDELASHTDSVLPSPASKVGPMAWKPSNRKSVEIALLFSAFRGARRGTMDHGGFSYGIPSN